MRLLSRANWCAQCLTTVRRALHVCRRLNDAKGWRVTRGVVAGLVRHRSGVRARSLTKPPLEEIMSLIRRALVALAATSASLAGVSLAPAVASAAPDPGAVYVLGNQPSGNRVLVYERAPDGTLTAAGSVDAGGLGTGGGLGSQGAIVTDAAGRYVYAVNAGSNSIAAFRVTRDGLTRTDVVASGGVMPTSLTVHEGLLYVLNAGGAGSIVGFTVDHGDLVAVARVGPPTQRLRHRSRAGVVHPGRRSTRHHRAGDAAHRPLRRGRRRVRNGTDHRRFRGCHAIRVRLRQQRSSRCVGGIRRRGRRRARCRRTTSVPGRWRRSRHRRRPPRPRRAGSR